MRQTIPYTVIGGYLGAGKTTLLNHLLRHSNGLRLAVMVNDFGDINIDADLVTSHDGETINLASGCICCSLADGFLLALNRISKRLGEIDHIVVEASGVSDPVRIGHYGAILKLDLQGVIVLVDAEQIRQKVANKYVGDTVLRQLQGADLLVINKVDLVTPAELDLLRAWLKQVAPGARLVEATAGQVPLPVLLGTLHPDNGAAAAESDHELTHHHDEHHHDEDHTALYETASFTAGAPMTRDKLEALLNQQPDSLLRAKGFVWLADDPTRRYVLQLVGRRWTLTPGEPWEQETPATRLVFIGLRGALHPDAIADALVAV